MYFSFTGKSDASKMFLLFVRLYAAAGNKRTAYISIYLAVGEIVIIIYDYYVILGGLLCCNMKKVRWDERFMILRLFFVTLRSFIYYRDDFNFLVILIVAVLDLRKKK